MMRILKVVLVVVGALAAIYLVLKGYLTFSLR